MAARVESNKGINLTARSVTVDTAGVRAAGYAKHVDMRWPVNPRSLTVVLTLGFVQAGGHMGTALDHADIRGF